MFLLVLLNLEISFRIKKTVHYISKEEKAINVLLKIHNQ